MEGMSLVGRGDCPESSWSKGHQGSIPCPSGGENVDIECYKCGKKDKHYTEDRDTSIGCYKFWHPYEYKYVCDDCMKLIIRILKVTGKSRRWYPFEIRG